MATRDDIAAKYPYLTFLLDHPEVGPLLIEAETPPKMTPDVFQARLMKTQWWKNTSDTQRDFYALKAGDPATYNRRRDELKSRLRSIGMEMGYDETVLDDGYLNHFADKAFEFGLTELQIRAMIADEITPLIGASEKGNPLRDMRRIQQDYSYAIDNAGMAYWGKEIAAGRQTIDNFENMVRTQMKDLFPNLSGQFDSGMTFKQIIDPYRQILSKEFDGANMENFDFMGDAKWRHVIDYVDEKTGVHRTMSMQELQKYARSQPEWRNTKNAKDQVSQIGEQLLESFGAI